MPPDCFKYLTRIHYKARSCDTWGEHEIDYILIVKRDVHLTVNPNEVKSVRYVGQQELKELLKSGDEGTTLVTPWFKLICQKFLFDWWSNLDNLDEEDTQIHRML